jgi:RES domain-containing protein
MLDAGSKPASHSLAARLRRAGFNGLLYPSFMSPGGSCAALWRWNGKKGPDLEVIDPDGRLPRTQASWTPTGIAEIGED